MLKLGNFFFTEMYFSHLRVDTTTNHFGFANWLFPSAESFLSARLLFFAAQKKKMFLLEMLQTSYSKINNKSNSTV
jgi:hypothetical protein